MNNKINTYYIIEDDYNHPSAWGYCDTYSTLKEAFQDTGAFCCRIVRYDGKGPGVVVREWNKDGKRVV